MVNEVIRISPLDFVGRKEFTISLASRVDDVKPKLESMIKFSWLLVERKEFNMSPGLRVDNVEPRLKSMIKFSLVFLSSSSVVQY